MMFSINMKIGRVEKLGLFLLWKWIMILLLELPSKSLPKDPKILHPLMILIAFQL
ncbi:hypothetical protein LR69_04346 [Geobacillus sp. BCO2]|nr:hypothetical protein LR69_04346 [Geobacillus sp. BCO2]